MEARGEPVQIHKAGGKAGDGCTPCLQICHPVHGVGQDVVDGHKGLAVFPQGDGVQGLFRPVDEALDIFLFFKAQGGDGGAAFSQLPQQGVVHHDAGMVQGVGRRRDNIGQQCNVADAAYIVQFVPVFQLFNERDQIDRLVFGVHIQHGFINNLVHDPIKVRALQDFRHLVHDAVVDEDGAEHGLFRFNVLGGYTFLHDKYYLL